MTRSSAALIAAGLALLAPAAAHGATLTTDRQCYVQGEGKRGVVSQSLTIDGAGWAPGSGWTVSGDQISASGTADPAGNFTTTGSAPVASSTGYKPQSFTITGQQDRADVATATFKVVNFLVKPRSTHGRPTGTTTWVFSGFTPSKRIFFHIKRGRKLYTSKAGRGDAVCGTLKKRLRRLPAVPKSAIRNGTYKVFVDNRRRFAKRGLQYTAEITVSQPSRGGA